MKLRTHVKTNTDGICFSSEKNSSIKKDMKGIVIGTQGKIVCVEFETNIGGHGGASSELSGKYGHCWWLPEQHVTKIHREIKDGELF